MILTANRIDLLHQTIQVVTLTVQDGQIAAIRSEERIDPELPYLLPGFIDAHVHIESSLLTPCQFARLAAVHGTVATVSDPHEIANVLGMEGVQYMITQGKRVPFKFFFGAPSCVPATSFETAGAVLNAAEIDFLLQQEEVRYLAEMMNFPGVLADDPEILKKLDSAKRQRKPVDGHAPGLTGDAAKAYFAAGISTDHECFTYSEALDKIKLGVTIIIREGSAAKNFDALIPLLADYPEQIMFCSDDKHPDSLTDGHVNLLVKRALNAGYPLFSVLRAACLNPVVHYGLPVGLLRENDPADFILIDNLSELNVLQTYIGGTLVADKGVTLIPDLRSSHPNQFRCQPRTPEAFRVTIPAGATHLQAIEALDGQLITNRLSIPLTSGMRLPDTGPDLLKIAVVNRYDGTAPPAIGFIHGFGLKSGAIASTVAHDSHNIIAVGCDDESLCKSINILIKTGGGIVALTEEETQLLALPIAGLMTDEDGYAVSGQYTKLDNFTKQILQSTLTSPFMTLSFMALLVIPSLKMSDKGLFNGELFEFTPTFLTKKP